MQHQDILITTNGRNGCHAIFPITLRGRSLVKNWTLDDDDCVEVKQKTVDKVVEKARSHDFDVAIVDWPVDITSVNAVHLRAQVAMRSAMRFAGSVFGPLLDAAFEARDKQRITDLYFQFPIEIERSFIVDRVRQTFPEFKERKLNMGNWLDA